MSDWQNKQLGTLCTIQTGKKDVNEGSQNGAYPFFTCSREVYASDTYSFDTEAILIAGNGAVGETKLYRGKFEAYQRTYVLDGFEEDLDFIFYVLKGSLTEALSKVVSGSTMPYIRKGDLERFPVPLPPLPEQKKIAHILSTVQRAIEAQERIIQITTELKKALMYKLFTEGLRNEPQKQTEVGPIPDSWKEVKLEETGTVVYGIQASVANNLTPVGTRILTNKNLTLDGGFDLEKINYFELKTKRHLDTILRKGDILFNWRSGSKHHIGKTAYFNLDGEWVHSSFILRIRPNTQINGRFLFYYLNYLREAEYFVKLHTYAINAKFNKSAVNALPTTLPSREEQDQIVSALDSVQRKLELAVTKQQAQRNLFRTLLHKLTTATIRV